MSKILLGFALVTTVTAGVGIFGGYYLTRLDDNDTILFEKMAVPLGRMGKAAVSFQQQQVGLLVAMQADFNDEVEEESVIFAKNNNDFIEHMGMVSATSLSDTDKAMVTDIIGLHKQYVEMSVRCFDLIKSGGKDQASQLFKTEMDETRAKLNILIDEALNYKEDLAKNTSDANKQIANRASMIMLILTVAGVLVAILFGMFTAHSIVRPLGEVGDAANRIAMGDLSADVKATSSDEIGNLARSVNIMTGNLREIVGQIKGGVDKLSVASESLAAASGNVRNKLIYSAQRTAEVAAASEESNSSVQAMAKGIESSSDNLRSVAAAGEEMSVTVAEIASSAAMARHVTEEGAKKSVDANRLVDSLQKASMEIEKITTTISDISDQTKLLALNATIEAARAGDAGKGFTVVANEIKDLARQTAQSTHEIAGKVAIMQNSTKGAVESIKGISASMAEIHQVVGSIAASFEEQSVTINEIAENVSNTSATLGEVSSRSSSVSSSSADILSNIGEVSSSMLDVSISADLFATNAEDLKALASDLKQLANKFKF